LLFHDFLSSLQIVMQREIEMANLQVKSIDDDLYRALGRRAAIQNRSISQEVVHILKSHLSKPLSDKVTPTQQFLELCGSWQDDASAQDMVEELRKARVNENRRQYPKL
jgi:hypothetical protein